MIASRVETLNWQCENPKIKELVEGIDDGSYDIDPEHQREFIASDKWKKDLIHSIFTVWSKKKDGNYLSVDGKQRMNAIYDCWKNQFKGLTFKCLN